MPDYNLELEALEGTITVVPALVFSANDSDKLVIAPYGILLKAIELIESRPEPDNVTIVELEGDNQVYRFEFPPGPDARDALRALKWFRDAIEFIGPLRLERE